ncbi:iron ABC transporter permease [Heyndrickxia sporothermodurans]|uniref:Iron ABC transporter permease n=2 Tax=Heyndrickxia TaxID=2837504 RepID=A0AB37HBP0_9BACI|nr:MULTISPECIES: iron ABC transporter permease [Heyndrickxia]MBL5767195.1 iron ABC transporter permease [Heyndrickxia sporothermodurans]MBL5770694.1 iron ABC transporter permease [Heyndrickxia sporothermodurans]MBL5774346.1 iron ABC transporter permease [Heyndrickxia sporothermodurans]MBL5779445.1 iron ABC transporter permease [Heyndrickxia sporothermodurans]MBL5781466.1 iron ABC transporter permease [Heyndrickxia sporothermodurans]
MSQFKNLRLFKGKISFLVDLRATWTILILFIVTLLALVISTGLGDMNINPINVVKTFFGGGSSIEQLVVLKFRLPRILVAMFVGIALAMAGGILQGIIRNPLASPDIIGITGGAGAAVVSFLAIFSNKDNSLTVSIGWMPIAAFLGATIVAFLVYFLAWKDGVSPIRLVLIGIGISAVMKAITTLLMLVGPIYRASEANIWLTGTVNGSSWGNVKVIVPWVLILTLISFLSARKINVQEFGDELATGVGSHVQRQRFFLLLLSTALVGAAVAFGGGIGFVGLMAPHIARRLVGSSFGVLLPASACIGGILVMVADLIGRTVFTPLEVPAGVFTAAIGAPYFIYLLFKSKSA